MFFFTFYNSQTVKGKGNIYEIKIACAGDLMTSNAILALA